jgi:hypothetical protein
MPERQLHDMLLQLDQELRYGSAIAEQDRELLERVKVDLETVLAARPQAEAAVDESLRERLGSAVRRFEADHPSLANLMNAALDALNRLGV